MPSKEDFQNAVNYALKQTFTNDFDEVFSITKDTPPQLVDSVREYFNTNNIAYSSFSYEDLKSYLN